MTLNEEMVVMLLECKRWHHGDAWRDSKQSIHREAWQKHMDNLRELIDKASQESVA